MKKIKFTHNTITDNSILILPQPTSKNLPEWYKKQEPYIGMKRRPSAGAKNEKPTTPATIKKCMPVQDVLTAGYYLYLHVDLYITMEDDGTHFFEWASQNAIDWHPRTQFSEYYAVQDKPINRLPKLMNPWLIKTPPGTSSLFIPPVHRENIISIMPGIVDTDTYNAAINFPFTTKENFDGLIPAGTPIVQVIPFQRDTWEMEIGGEVERDKATSDLLKISTTFFDRYKSFFWHKKEFK